MKNRDYLIRALVENESEVASIKQFFQNASRMVFEVNPVEQDLIMYDPAYPMMKLTLELTDPEETSVESPNV